MDEDFSVDLNGNIHSPVVETDSVHVFSNKAHIGKQAY